MPDAAKDDNSGRPCQGLSRPRSRRISVDEIARRLDIGRLAVYAILERAIRGKNTPQSGEQYFLIDRHSSGNTRPWPPV